MEALSGKYDTLACIDVMIHYPTDKVLTAKRETRTLFFQLISSTDVWDRPEAGLIVQRKADNLLRAEEPLLRHLKESWGTLSG